jgi:hypothetical protein
MILALAAKRKKTIARAMLVLLYLEMVILWWSPVLGPVIVPFKLLSVK